MPTDNPIPLATAAQMQEGPFADLVRAYTPTALNDLMLQATRAVETEADRRLAPFTAVTETHRAQGIDPDEYADSANLPLDLQGTLGRSYAFALGASNLVRHCWLNQYAPQYTEYWSYSNVSVTVIRSYGGSQAVTSAQYTGPELDSGHVWFNLGQFIPIGSLVRVTYSGGYGTVPADLVRATIWMAGAIAAKELDPNLITHGHDAGTLEAAAVAWVAPYQRHMT